ncbi:hypothetical protein RYX36_009828, partial [Vicia faba]
MLPPIGNKVLKAFVEQFNVDQLLTDRLQVSPLVRDSLVRRAKDFNILLDDVSITHLPNGAGTDNLGLEYDEKMLLSIGNEVLKSFVEQFNADQLLTDRLQVSPLVRDSLVRRAKDFNILLDDVAITHLPNGA